MYDVDIHQKITATPNHQKLKTMVKRSTDQKLRFRNFESRHGRIEQEQWSRVERDREVAVEEKVLVISGKKKANVRKETSAVSRHESNDRAQFRNRTQMPPHLRSHP